jgi:MarR family transcriptional regulator, organic hydroperoxide resistance regulator
MKKQTKGGFLISKIHQLSGIIFNRKLRKYKIELNSAQGRIMFILWGHDGIPINELARKTSLQKSTLTSMLDRLESSGYIKREPSISDRRSILIKRTEKDRSLQGLYQKVSMEMTDLYYKGFSDTEIFKFENYLERILNNLEKFE